MAEGFVRPEQRERIALEEQPEPLLEWLERHEVTVAPKWLDGSIT